jgi:hypothetical protein
VHLHIGVLDCELTWPCHAVRPAHHCVRPCSTITDCMTVVRPPCSSPKPLRPYPQTITPTSVTPTPGTWLARPGSPTLSTAWVSHETHGFCGPQTKELLSQYSTLAGQLPLHSSRCGRTTQLRLQLGLQRRLQHLPPGASYWPRHTPSSDLHFRPSPPAAPTLPDPSLLRISIPPLCSKPQPQPWPCGDKAARTSTASKRPYPPPSSATTPCTARSCW